MSNLIKVYTLIMMGLYHIRNSAWLRCALVALMLGCVLVCTIGEYVVVKALCWNIRQEIKSHIKSGVPTYELVQVKISKINPPKDFVRIDRREFRLNGGMYDIVNQEEQGDTILYHCILDERETVLYANVEQQIKKEFTHNPSRQQQQKELLQKIPKFFFLHTNLCFEGFKCFPEKPMNRQHLLSGSFLEILSPPPDLI
ncbi:MAG: hypothetical protein SFU99_10495 [Saprospiraceae bacterium]|nr:hypothetical protein [Saprospiraceae bacterium]